MVSAFQETFRVLLDCVPGPLVVFLGAVFVILAGLAFWVPGNLHDPMAGDLLRLKLERFGPLDRVGTIELQAVFPRFFDELHRPFLAWGWATVAPSFLLFCLLIVAVVTAFPPHQALHALFWITLCQPLMVCVTSQKNDFPTAVFAFLGWLLIFYAPPGTWNLPLCLMVLAMLVGTKWHGALLAVPLLGMLLFRVFTVWPVNAAGWVLTAALVPVYLAVGSAGTYLRNLRRYGTPFPKFSWLGHETPRPLRNVAAFLMTSLVETLEPLLHVLDRPLKGRLWQHVARLTLGGKGWGFSLTPNAEYATYGAPILVLVGASVVSLFHGPVAVRAAGALALLYFAVLMVGFTYHTRINRYFLPVYLMGVPPAVHLFGSLALPPWLRGLLLGWLAWNLLQVVLLNQERPLMATPVWNSVARSGWHMPSLWPWFFDREALYFTSWMGYRRLFLEMRDRVRPCHSLLVVNLIQGEDAPFLYPFLMGRSPANTDIHNARYGVPLEASWAERFDHLLVFGGHFALEGFQQVAACEQHQTYLYGKQQHLSLGDLIARTDHLLGEGKHAEALPLLADGVGRHAPNATLFRLLSIALGQSGQLPQAREAMLQAVQLQPEDPVLRNELGHLHFQLGDLPRSRAAFQQALTLDPSFQTARENLAVVEAALRGGAGG